jgi:hypothetical protein
MDLTDGIQKYHNKPLEKKAIVAGPSFLQYSTLKSNMSISIEYIHFRGRGKM